MANGECHGRSCFGGGTPDGIRVSKLNLLSKTTGKKPEEVVGDNRSVMPLDTPGRTRNTMEITASTPAPEGVGKLQIFS